MALLAFPTAAAAAGRNLLSRLLPLNVCVVSVLKTGKGNSGRGGEYGRGGGEDEERWKMRSQNEELELEDFKFVIIHTSNKYKWHSRDVRNSSIHC